MNAARDSHTRIENFLHNLAFKPWYPSVSLSNFESKIYKEKLTNLSVEKPVFITALPRAGTTLLLKLCVETNEFASHSYRDMPFLMTPLFWDRFSRGFRNSSTSKERVHGDGIFVNVGSPESFEEIIWKEFWPSYYKKDRIIPWSERTYPEFENFFFEHIKKIILLRGIGDKQVRYISKNNLNIARVHYLSKIIPDSTIIVLFRSPLQQAASLLKQHRNFLGIHKKDPFAQKYMKDTGHYDFGENLRPVDFKGWFSRVDSHDPNTLSFWLRYWINTYQYLLRRRNDRIRFFSYDSLCEEPHRALGKYGEILTVKNIELFMKNVDRIKIPQPHALDTDDISPTTFDQAQDLFFELQKAAKV